MPVLILLGLRFGYATPTEIAVLTVIYSLVLSAFLYRDLTWRRFYDAVVEAGVATGIVMLVIMGSAVVGWILTFDQVPVRFAEWVATTLHEPFLIILAMNILMLLVGMPLDLPPAILLLGPIFVPLAATIGLDPVQLGLIMILNLGIGLYTPPIGTTLFISSSIAGSSLSETTRELWPFFAVAIAAAPGPQLHSRRSPSIRAGSDPARSCGPGRSASYRALDHYRRATTGRGRPGEQGRVQRRRLLRLPPRDRSGAQRGRGRTREAAIAARGWRLVYGGGEVGLMGVAARAALAAGGKVLGIIPQRLLDREVGKHDLTELRITATMFERKEILIAESDAFVALPGGLGTLDEILDVVTLRQLGYHAKPMLLLDIAGYWRGCQAVFEQFVTAGFADPASARRHELVPDLPGVLARLDLVAGRLVRSERQPRSEVSSQSQQPTEEDPAKGLGTACVRQPAAQDLSQQCRHQRQQRPPGQLGVQGARAGQRAAKLPWRR